MVIVLPMLPGEDERTMELDIRNMIKDHQVCYDEGGWLGENVSAKRASHFKKPLLTLSSIAGIPLAPRSFPVM